MTLAEVVLPLRLTNPHVPLQDMLMEWMSHDAKYDPRDCLEDLQTLANLRHQMAVTIANKHDHEAAYAMKDVLHQYYHGLWQCEKCKIGMDDSPKRSICLEWESAMMVEIQVGHSLDFEKANLLWNLAAIEAYQALQQHPDLNGYKAAGRHLETAASWLHHMNSSGKPFPFMDFHPKMIRLWKGLLLAEAQHCAFQSHRCSFQPDHETLAEMAVAAVSMYSSLGTILQQDSSCNSAPILSQPLIQQWGQLIEGMLQYMKFMAAYHQAMDCRQKSLFAQESILLKVAKQEATEFLQAYQQQSDQMSSFASLEASIRNPLFQIDERIKQTSLQIPEQQHNGGTAIATEEELPKLTGTSQAYILPLERILQSYPARPLFSIFLRASHHPQSVARKQSPTMSLQESEMSKRVDSFRTKMERLIQELAMEVEEKRQHTRQTLANVRLPYSLTAYKQELQGGGIPQDLWQRVEAVQRDRLVELLKQELWDLQDASETAFRIHRQAKSQLDLDLENDRNFRMDNPSFQGRNTKQLQLFYREQLSNYHRLLSAAHQGDAVLIQRAEQLDTNPKFKLLHFKQSQLNKLVPAKKDGGKIDVAQLSALILRLNRMFSERDALLNNLQEDMQSFDSGIQMRKKTSAINHKRDYMYASSYFEGPFQERVNNIRQHMDAEKPLVQEILQENLKFMEARLEQTNCSSADDCIAVLEESIEELDQITNHLEEGKKFYHNITIKLEKLRGQVDELSTKLMIERLEYNDTESRDRQEEADALMAKRLSQDTPSAAAAAAAGVARGQPGWVDDEKVATLVAMDFDPSRVVDALKNQNNDVDAALNELLSSA